MTQCPKCGARVKYIPVSYQVDTRGTIAVEPEYTEVINDNGRVLKGYPRHICPKKKEAQGDKRQEGFE
jgi:hypothetical protein